VQRYRARSRRTEGPHDVTSCRRTTRRYSVQINRATAWCRRTARRYVAQRDGAMPCGAEGPRDATRCRETARCHVVQRDRATPRGEVRGTTRRQSCRGTARRYVVQRPRDTTACRGKLCRLWSMPALHRNFWSAYRTSSIAFGM